MMSNESFIVATILDVVPDASYRGKVYTQFVRLGTSQTADFTVYDAMEVSRELIGKTCAIWLTTFLGKNYLQDTSSIIMGVRYDDSLSVSAIKTVYETRVSLCGQVVGVDANEGRFLLDIGIGKIVCDGIDILNSTIGEQSQDRRIRLGDYVCHCPTRIDLRAIQCK